MLKTKLMDDVYFFTDTTIFKDECNASIIFTEVGPVLIDTFGTPEHFKYLENFIHEQGYDKLAAVFYTHGHLDHVLGHQSINPSYPVYGHEYTMKVMNDAKDRVLPKIVEAGFVKPGIKLVYPTHTIKTEDHIQIGNNPFKLIHTPGHSIDSITIFDEKRKLAFVGDNFIMMNNQVAIPRFNFEQGITPETNEYLNTYTKVKKLNPKIIIQGHGPIIQPKDYFHVIDEYVSFILNYALNAYKSNISINELESKSYKDILSKDLIQEIWGLDTKHSSFQHNLLSAYRYFKENNE